MPLAPPAAAGAAPPTARSILGLLQREAASFPPARRHLSRRPCGDSPPVAVTLGATAYANGRPALSKATRRHVALTRALCAFARDAIARGRGGAVGTFTSVQVNRNCRMRLHTDHGNQGPSLAIALGAFTGGALHVAERGDLDLHDRWESYDGAAPHCTRPWEGERFVLVFFTVRGARSALGGAEKKLPTALHRRLR